MAVMTTAPMGATQPSGKIGYKGDSYYKYPLLKRMQENIILHLEVALAAELHAALLAAEAGGIDEFRIGIEPDARVVGQRHGAYHARGRANLDHAVVLFVDFRGQEQREYDEGEQQYGSYALQTVERPVPTVAPDAAVHLAQRLGGVNLPVQALGFGRQVNIIEVLCRLAVLLAPGNPCRDLFGLGRRKLVVEVTDEQRFDLSKVHSLGFVIMTHLRGEFLNGTTTFFHCFVKFFYLRLAVGLFRMSKVVFRNGMAR